MQPQTRVRRMRRIGRHHGQSTDGIRQVYYDPAVRAAKAVRETGSSDRSEQDEQEDPQP